jgi:hypothetical protein
VRFTRGACLALFAVARDAHAHGFGQRYDLPLPLELYVTGAALTVVVSCVIFALYLRAAPRQRWSQGIDLRFPSLVVAILRGLAVLAYALIVFAGLFGNQNPFKNLVPVSVWAVGWVGLAYMSALVGDFWKIANPLDTLFAPFERFTTKRPMPRALGCWPAVAFYALFLWMEIAWDGSDSPRAIVIVILVYSVLTGIAMAYFGREAWLERGEALSRFFATLGRFAPLHFELSPERRVVACRLRPYAAGLIPNEPLTPSEIAFVILVLAGVSFDGFLETPAWQALDWPRTAGLFAAPVVFACVYLLFCRLIAAAGGMKGAGAVQTIAGSLALTLVPIAIAYEVAHYFSFLVQAAQYLVPIASDPFGWGWNLFGTANVFVRLAVVETRIVWIVSVIAIVAGHVAAIYLGHVLAMRIFPEHRAAVRSEGPMLVLMVAYTMLSLWIVAQPIVSTR